MGPRVQVSGSCYVVAMGCGHTMWLLWSVVIHNVVAMECGHMLWGCYVVCGEVRDRAEVLLVLISVLSLLLQQI